MGHPKVRPRWPPFLRLSLPRSCVLGKETFQRGQTQFSIFFRISTNAHFPIFFGTFLFLCPTFLSDPFQTPRKKCGPGASPSLVLGASSWFGLSLDDWSDLCSENDWSQAGKVHFTLGAVSSLDAVCQVGLEPKSQLVAGLLMPDGLVLTWLNLRIVLNFMESNSQFPCSRIVEFLSWHVAGRLMAL